MPRPHTRLGIRTLPAQLLSSRLLLRLDHRAGAVMFCGALKQYGLTPQVRFDHQANEFSKRRLRAPTELRAGLASVSLQFFDFQGPEISRVTYNVATPIETEIAKGPFH